MGAEDGAEAALGAVALDGGADGGDGRDHSNAREGGRDGLVSAPEKPDGKGAAVEPAALFAHGTEITRAPQMLLRAETHGAEKAEGRKG